MIVLNKVELFTVDSINNEFIMMTFLKLDFLIIVLLIVVFSIIDSVSCVSFIDEL